MFSAGWRKPATACPRAQRATSARRAPICPVILTGLNSVHLNAAGASAMPPRVEMGSASPMPMKTALTAPAIAMSPLVELGSAMPMRTALIAPAIASRIRLMGLGQDPIPHRVQGMAVVIILILAI